MSTTKHPGTRVPERSSAGVPRNTRYVFRVFRLNWEHGVRERIDTIAPQDTKDAATAAGQPIARFNGDEVYVVRRVLTLLH